MSPSTKNKCWLFIVEGLTSYAATTFGYYVYFLTHTKYDFDKKSNLLLAAGAGLAYAIFSWLGGKVAQRFGYISTLRMGLIIATLALTFGSLLEKLWMTLTVLIVTTLGFCMIFPAVEAELAEGEPPPRLQYLVGLYNIVWAATGAVAYFLGGTILEQIGSKAVFLVPAFLVLVGVAVAMGPWTTIKAHTPGPTGTIPASENPPSGLHYDSSASQRKNFMYMAWIANPLAYAAINTLVSIAPDTANRLSLSPMWAGFYGSIWLFARVLSFLLLMRTSFWHYRFNVLLLTCAALILSFTTTAVSPNIPVFILSQIVFGMSIGLIYYSSLYYSMHVGETKGEHGGIHEAAIGIGNFSGPAIGALASTVTPNFQFTHVIAVGALLVFGILGIIRLRPKDSIPHGKQ